MSNNAQIMKVVRAKRRRPKSPDFVLIGVRHPAGAGSARAECEPVTEPKPERKRRRRVRRAIAPEPEPEIIACLSSSSDDEDCFGITNQNQANAHGGNAHGGNIDFKPAFHFADPRYDRRERPGREHLHEQAVDFATNVLGGPYPAMARYKLMSPAQLEFRGARMARLEDAAAQHQTMRGYVDEDRHASRMGRSQDAYRRYRGPRRKYHPYDSD